MAVEVAMGESVASKDRMGGLAFMTCVLIGAGLLRQVIPGLLYAKQYPRGAGELSRMRKGLGVLENFGVVKKPSSKVRY